MLPRQTKRTFVGLFDDAIATGEACSTVLQVCFALCVFEEGDVSGESGKRGERDFAGAMPDVCLKDPGLVANLYFNAIEGWACLKFWFAGEIDVIID
jgi:hypothetical protein